MRENGLELKPAADEAQVPEDVVTKFLLQVETMHDFEAANSDELELKRGEVVLVVPTASVEDLVRTSEQRKETPALLMVL